jgi:hypothetical protein
MFVEAGNSAFLSGVNHTRWSCADSAHGMRFIREFFVLLFFIVGLLHRGGGGFSLV